MYVLVQRDTDHVKKNEWMNKVMVIVAWLEVELRGETKQKSQISQVMPKCIHEFFL